jgi:hypothetical protein
MLPWYFALSFIFARLRALALTRYTGWIRSLNPRGGYVNNRLSSDLAKTVVRKGDKYGGFCEDVQHCVCAYPASFDQLWDPRSEWLELKRTSGVNIPIVGIEVQ